MGRLDMHLSSAPWNPSRYDTSDAHEICVLEARGEWSTPEKRAWPRDRVKRWFRKLRRLTTETEEK